MKMRLHELHPATIHLPLTLLPMAAGIDAVALATGSSALDSLGRTTWWAAVAATLFAGISGAAASQEVKAEAKPTRDMIVVHGLANSLVAISGVAIALVRTKHAATILTTGAALAGVAAALYSASLGGKLVYAHGVGVKAMAPYDPNGMGDSPALLSKQAPLRLLVDGVKGFAWVFRSAFAFATGADHLAPAALGFGEEEAETRLGLGTF